MPAKSFEGYFNIELWNYFYKSDSSNNEIFDTTIFTCTGDSTILMAERSAPISTTAQK